MVGRQPSGWDDEDLSGQERPGVDLVGIHDGLDHITRVAIWGSLAGDVPQRIPGPDHVPVGRVRPPRRAPCDPRSDHGGRERQGANQEDTPREASASSTCSGHDRSLTERMFGVKA